MNDCPASVWIAVRDINVIIFRNERDYKANKAASLLLKKFQLKDKEDRITLYQGIKGKVTPEFERLMKHHKET